MNASAAVLGSKGLTYTNFPFAADASNLEGQLKSTKGYWRGIPSDLHPFIIRSRPYPGGNDILHRLHSFSNPAKHHAALMVDIAFGPMGFGGTQTFSASFVSVGNHQWSDDGTRCEIFRLRRGQPASFGFHVDVRIKFNTQTSLSKYEVVPTLRMLLDITEEIIVKLGAETARIALR